jgi:hypothetical protein
VRLHPGARGIRLVQPLAQIVQLGRGRPRGIL